MSDTKFDIVCIGDALVDAFLGLHAASVHCRLDRTKCELCVQYGAKIPLDDCQFLIGGNGANVSVGISRLGYKAGIVAEIGEDEFASKIEKALMNEAVDIERLIQTKGAQSTFSMIINFQGERTIFTKHITRVHDFSFENLQTQWVYLTSLGNEWKHVYKKAVELTESSGAKLAFNPGSLQLDEGMEEIVRVIDSTDVLFVNRQEAEAITKSIKGTKSIRSIKGGYEEVKNLLIELQKMGAKRVIITDGARGSYAIDEKGSMFFCNTFEAPRIEMTGAGDSYASGVLGALLSNLSLEEAMEWGTVNATSVIGKIGAQPGLLTQDEIIKEIENHKELEVEELH